MSLPTRCVPSDAPAFAEVFVSAFETSPRHKVTYGSIPRDQQVSMFTEKFAKGIESQAHPTATQQRHCIKVSDPTSGELMAFAVWEYLPQGYKREEDWGANITMVPEGANERFTKDFAQMTGNVRGRHEGRKGPHWLLSLLGTHPKHERRGAAAALIRWPYAQADKDKKSCYVEASVVAYQLYSRCGFRDIDELVVDLDKYDDRGFGVARWVSMMREPEVS